jgi:hypothetical protein
LIPHLWKAKRGPRKSSHLPKHLHHPGWRLESTQPANPLLGSFKSKERC